MGFNYGLIYCVSAPATQGSLCLAGWRGDLVPDSAQQHRETINSATIKSVGWAYCFSGGFTAEAHSWTPKEVQSVRSRNIAHEST